MYAFVRKCLLMSVSLSLCSRSHAQEQSLRQTNKEAVYAALAIAYPENFSLELTDSAPAKRNNIAQINRWAAMPVPTLLPDVKPSDLAEMLASLHPKAYDRFFRSISLQDEIDQQPSKIQVADGTFQNTPQGVLQKGSITFTGAQMFPGSDEVQQEVQTWTTAGGKLTADVHHGYCKPNEAQIERIAHCLLRDRKRDRLGRFGSGLVVTFSLSENNRIRNGISIPNGSDAAFANNQISGSIVYDPSRLLHTGTDWKNAQAASLKYLLSQDSGRLRDPTTVAGEVKRLAGLRCKVGANAALIATAPCVNRLAGLTGAGRLWPLLFPQVTFKEQTQFDFIKYGNGYVPYSGIQPSLATITVSWDIGKTIASAAARRDAFVAVTEMMKTQTKPTNPKRADVQAAFIEAALNERRFENQAWVDDFLKKLATVAASEGLTAATLKNGS